MQRIHQLSSDLAIDALRLEAQQIHLNVCNRGSMM